MPEKIKLTKLEAQKVVKDFIETSPLLRPLSVLLKEPIDHPSRLIPERIQHRCGSPQCSALPSTTWARTELTADLRVDFECAHCRARTLGYWFAFRNPMVQVNFEAPPVLTNNMQVRVGREALFGFELLKVGQWPPWNPEVSNRLEKNLGVNIDLFRRAVSCIRQSWGIGACAYMRRVIEEETAQILDLVERAAKSEGDEETLKNVVAARTQTVASERLEHASRRLPASLRPGNVNPLARLFGAFSEAVHELPEEEALATAVGLMDTFIFLFENLRDRVDEAEAYAKKIKAVGNPAH